MTPVIVLAGVHILAAISAAWAPCAGLAPRRWLTCMSVAGAARAEGVSLALALAREAR